MKNRLLLLLLAWSMACLAQPGKDGPLTVTAANRIINNYCPVSSNIPAGSSTIAITTPTLLSLCPGDLIMVYQAQGATINTVNTSSYGDVTQYNSAGLYEFKYVQNITGNIITTQTTFTNSYAISGRVQVVKVPQYTSLTINTGASITAKKWQDTLISATPFRFGGLVVIHANTIINNGTITASGSGFRGGAATFVPGLSLGRTAFTSTLTSDGGEKGESIAGYQADYVSGRRGMGAPANGGGGGNGHDAAGGGGGNGNNGNAWTGQGVMIVNSTNLLAAWSLSSGYIANGNALTTSSGGGHGGYSYGDFNANATIQGPGNGIWVGDSRREVGGFGGRPLSNINAETRIYFGGGGGAAHISNNASGPGADGGGIVYLITPAGISGTGTISSHGNSSVNSSGCNCDGLSGAGAGGSIIIKSNLIAPTQVIGSTGGKGGNQLFPVAPSNPDESEGPGGGGGGGFVALSAVGIIPAVNGGLNGTTLSNAVAGEMTANGATQGADGQTLTVSAAFIPFTPTAGSGTTAAGSNAPLCLGNALNFTTTAGIAHTWSGPNNFSSTIQNPSITVTTLAMAGIYTVVISQGNCQLPQTGTVSVSFLPTPILSISNSSLCPGNTGTLTASGLSSYTWFPSNTSGSQYSDAPTSTSAYTAVGTSAQGCTIAASASLVIYPTPLFSFASAVNCASPGSATVFVSGGTGAYSYTWSPSAQTNSSINNIYPGTYTVSVLDQGIGCTFNSSSTFTPSVPFTGTVVTANASCNGSSDGTASITVAGGSGNQSYSWSNNSGVQTSPTAGSLNAGVHTVTITDMPSLCKFTQAFTITQPAPLVLNVTANSPTACTGSTLNLTALSSGGTAGYTYSWSPGPTTGTYTAAYTTAGTYSYSVTSNDAHNCSVTKTLAVTFIATPTITASSATICQNASVTFTASGAAVYVWYPPGFTGPAFSANPSASTLYTVIGNTQGCFAQTTASVFTNPLPVPAIVSSNTVCNGQALLLNGSGTGAYAWTGPGNFTSTAQSPAIMPVTLANSGNYYLTLTSAQGCTATAGKFISVLPNPLPVVSNATVCIGEPVVLFASGGISYAWSGPSNFSSFSPTLSFAVVTASVTGNYTVVVTGSNSCQSFSIAQLIGNPFPLPTPTISSKSHACMNTVFNLNGSGGESYSWHGPAGFASTSQNPSFIPTALSMSGIYTLSVKNNSNCAASATVMLNLYPQPKGAISSSASKFCVPSCPDFKFNASTSGVPVTSYTFQFNNKALSDSTINYCFNAPGSYTVKAFFTDTNSCVNTASVLVTAYEKPSADFELFPINPLAITDPVLFTNTSVGADQTGWYWYFSDHYKDSITAKNNRHVFENPGDYAIAMVVKNKWGCADTMIKTITVGEEFSLYVPDAFTPNGDDINDTFQPKGINIKKYRLLIFDRWGKNLFESADFYTGWNGRYRGEICTDDVYIWKIEVTLNGGRSKTYTGRVSLVR